MELINYQISDKVAFITINRPEKRNALNPQLVHLLTEAFSRAINDELIKVIILKSTGSVFSAGADLTYLQELQNNTDTDNQTDTESLRDLFYRIYTCPKVVIAQVEGHAIAGGCGLVSVCDIIFAVPEAKFGYTEVKIGFIPALVTCFLIRKLGEGRTRELLLSGDLISAQTAERYGLINFVIERSEISGKVRAYADRLISSVSGQSLSLTKHLIVKVQDLTLEESLTEAVRLNVQARSSDDCKKGISAFLNNEKLEW